MARFLNIFTELQNGKFEIRAIVQIAADATAAAGKTS